MTENDLSKVRDSQVMKIIKNWDLKKNMLISNIINCCQELVELDLLIYPVPGFVSIRSLGAEISHFVSGPFKINGFPYKTIGFPYSFVMKTHKNTWISLKNGGVQTQNVISPRSEIRLRQIRWLDISPGSALQAGTNSLQS